MLNAKRTVGLHFMLMTQKLRFASVFNSTMADDGNFAGEHCTPVSNPSSFITSLYTVGAFNNVP